jgi:pantoate--beta-alanine ligase
MGALHEGHLALVAEARRRAAFVVVTIFVNPTQFGPKEDFARYPRSLDRDQEMCETGGVHGIFAPSVGVMYPPGEETRVQPGRLAEPLEGTQRPGHFEGVATIVAKLFALTGPSVAIFGRKDYQQWKVVERLARDLFLPVEVIGAPTVREPDGLALSSRNRYLDSSERQRARSIAEGLTAAARAFDTGERTAGVLANLARAPIAQAGASIDYVAVTCPETLQAYEPAQHVGARALVVVAARFGATRLLDNLVLGEERGPHNLRGRAIHD